ncbi:NAD(P)H-binding protein [Mucilaginibacter calamicampi]|uniref:NAD(P)H-binding protein n=1 Tax=Mucilaginibacter calamicampi TaxID=1302352 RepID=A0ABW2YW67_9SPHI
MKIIITGSLGNISRPLSTTLAANGHNVTVISSDSNKSAQIKSIGATPAIGSITDEDFLTRTFTDADVVYLMIPTDFSAPDIKANIAEVAQHYANAVKASGIKKVILLSSLGAHLPEGTGPIAGIHRAEEILKKQLEGVDLLILRPSYFYNNFYADINMIKHAGIIGSNFGANKPLVMVDPEDIAAIAAENIEKGFTGISVLYIGGDKRTLSEVAAELGKAIGKPELPWVEFTDEQAYDGMRGAGLPEDIAKNYVEMGAAIRTGLIWDDFDLDNAELIGKTKLEDFAVKFAAAYKA